MNSTGRNANFHNYGNLSFIFIPDISGYTKFVNETEIEHSKHIISELIEIIIASNNLNMIIAEVEGDAVLFYKEQIPDLGKIYEQVKDMFINFHHHLRKYEVLRICECGACSSAVDLTLKFIVHAGEFEKLTIAGKAKPYGSSVVLAHRLLKNNLPNTEYLLLTHSFYEQQPSHSMEEYFPQYYLNKEAFPDFGYIKYFYVPLEDYHTHVPPVVNYPVPQLSRRPFKLNQIINAPIRIVQDRLIDLNFKKKWLVSVNSVQFKDPINKLGTHHVCIINNEEHHFETIKNSLSSNGWVYGERMINPSFVKEIDFYFILRELSSESTLLEFELHIKAGKWLMKMIAPLVKMILSSHYRKSIRIFKKVIEGEYK
jgi:hypothetical protein